MAIKKLVNMAIKNPKKDTPYKVLFIDDQADEHDVVAYAFESLGCVVESVCDGFEAREKLFGTEYDLVVVDWTMPHLNGKETLIALQDYMENLGRGKLPFVIYSGRGKEEVSVPQVDSLLFKDYWQKPLNLDDLILKAKKVLEEI